MTGRLEGKVAVVTGGASGMGLATVRRFLDEGAAVVLADLNEATAETALAELAAAGHTDKVRSTRVDVAEEADVVAMVATAVDTFGQLDVLFNNAGIGGAFGALTDLHVQDWDYTFNVLVRGVFLGMKHGSRQMISQGWGGSIINTGSVAGLHGGAGPLCYSTAKAAVNHLSRTAALELAPHRIRINTILPGAIMTPLMHGGDPEKAARAMAPFVPWPELGQPEHIAGAALFYASDDSAYVTGDATLVDGGMVAVTPGIVMHGGLESAPAGYAGVNRGTTGQGTTIRQRPPR
jgi:NAD(P)-dependent dehydrogenase (short-subunit alcohol dehydrogenase family)